LPISASTVTRCFANSAITMPRSPICMPATSSKPAASTGVLRMLDQPLTTTKMIGEKDGPIGRITFNNPARHNAVSLEMWQALAQIMEDFERDDAIRVIVVTGAGGKAFVSGADISEFKEKRNSEEAAAEI